MVLLYASKFDSLYKKLDSVKENNIKKYAKTKMFDQLEVKLADSSLEVVSFAIGNTWLTLQLQRRHCMTSVDDTVLNE